MKGGTGDPGSDEILRAFLAGRRSAAKADPDFSSRVMASVRDWERERLRAGVGSRGRSAPNPERPGRPGRGWFPAWPRPVLGVAFSFLLLLSFSGLWYFGPGTGGNPEVPDITRIKGEGFRLGFLLKREGRLAPAVAGMEFLPGDLLQAVYSAPVRGRFHLFSLDEAGEINCFSCSSPDTLLPAGQDRPLSYALELDASPKREVFVGFWSERPVASDTVSALLKAAWNSARRDLAALPKSLPPRLPPGLEVSLFPIRKKETTRHGIH